MLTSNQVAVKSNLHIAPTSKTIIPPTSHSAFQKWDTTRYTYCPSFVNVLCDRLNIFSHWLPLLSHALTRHPGVRFCQHCNPWLCGEDGDLCKGSQACGWLHHPDTSHPLLCICIPLLGCIDPQIRTSVKDISPLGSAPVTMAFAAKISCDGSCKHKHHHLVESLMHHKLKNICKQKHSSSV